ncbi:putative baseplate assembly protein [Azotobacter chroococcum]|uniref:putative baseplate assembly protein n=1 Tax=Azotobacter chroococcum TaxID=353 RepID=UPI0010ADAA40|nr:putative baseplate assembly protein [Azotobacter chroococcum]TKD35894.1 putative baseplate assembly protein [Azotobacter chroococcum]
MKSETIGYLTDIREELLADGHEPAKSALLEAISSYFLGGSATDGKTQAEVYAQAGGANRAAQDLLAIFKGINDLSGIELKSPKQSRPEDVFESSSRQPKRQAPSGRQLSRSAGTGLVDEGEDRLNLLKAMNPELGPALSAALNALPITAVEREIDAPLVYLLRTTASVFSSMAPPVLRDRVPVDEDHQLESIEAEFSFLDAVYGGIQPGSYVVFARPYIQPDSEPPIYRSLRLARVRSAESVARRSYNISGKSTRLELVDLAGKKVSVLREPELVDDRGNAVSQRASIWGLRNTLFYVQSEPVRLADDSDPDDVGGDTVELQSRIEGLQSGQWLIVVGERTDIRDANRVPVPGVRGGELAMIVSVSQAADPEAPGDTLHTVIGLVKPLAYSYKRSSVILYGNVIKASHGETVSEVLGSGDARRSGQRFMLSRLPLTFIAASTPAGVESTEVVRVNGIRYRSLVSLLDVGGDARAYQLDTDEMGAATLTFGDGMRLPSGVQNVRATYRVGIGSSGNVRAEQISLLATRPLGVAGVINPLRASGGADRDGKERIRSSVPLAVHALSPLSRLVSVADYAEFAHLFAGIGHAEAIRLSDGAQEVVLVTVAGVDDIPLDHEGELLGNLRAAYARYGDPVYPVEIVIRELKALVIEAKVAIEPDVDWNLVEPELRRRLLDAFSFERRKLGQPTYLSEIIAVTQGTPGVAWVDVDKFGGVTESEVRNTKKFGEALKDLGANALVPALRGRSNPDWLPRSKKHVPRFWPAQIAFLLPEIRDLLVLNPA